MGGYKWWDQLDLKRFCEDSLSLSSRALRQYSQVKSNLSISSTLTEMPRQSRWYQPEPLHLFSLEHCTQQASGMFLPQMHLSSSSFLISSTGLRGRSKGLSSSLWN